MWSAVPDIEDLSSDSGSDESVSGNFEGKSSNHERTSETSNAPFVDNTATAPPRGVAELHWESFCKLKRRREDSSQLQSHNPDSRRNKAKKQKTKHRTDQKDVSLSEAQPSSSSEIRSQRDKSELINDEKSTSSKLKTDTEFQGPEERRAPNQKQQEHWDTLKKYLNVNEHVHQGIDHGQFNPNKSGLEKQLDQAVEEGNFEQAEELSDQLAKRDLACKIAKSADARDYLNWKEAQETKRKATRKKKKLNWGFEAKERWQMKGNM